MLQASCLLFIFIWAEILFAQQPKVLFSETFEDDNFSSRGWYDQLKGTLSTSEHIPGSSHSLECRFTAGARTPVGGTPGRHLFEETDEVYLSYWVKYSANYVGSGKPYHPHEFSFVTNKNDKWIGPAFTHLTTYIEHNGGVPFLAIQDGQNIDQANVGKNLVLITEQRGVAGCNGSSDGYADDCYKAGNVYVNGKVWRAAVRCFGDEQGAFYKNDWHHIEAYFKLNSIKASKGINDGVVRYWFDEALIIDHDDVLMRTAVNADMKFNQFLIVPYIGDGSPVDQTMWIDDLLVATSRLIPSDVTTGDTMTPVVYPNPATEFLVLKGYTGVVIIANALGELQWSGTLDKQSKIDCSKFSPGLYFVKSDSAIEKFIVVR